MNAHARAALALASMLALVACGFHLRGAAESRLPYSSVHVQAEKVNPEWTRAVESALASAGAKRTDARDAAPVTLVLFSEQTLRRTLSVGAAGRAEEYELNYVARFALESESGEIILPEQRIERMRSYTFDTAQVLGKENEEALLWRDMRRDAARELVRRIAAAHK